MHTQGNKQNMNLENVINYSKHWLQEIIDKVAGCHAGLDGVIQDVQCVTGVWQVVVVVVLEFQCHGTDAPVYIIVLY